MWSARLILLGLAFTAVVVRGQPEVCTQPVKLGISIDESGSIDSSDFDTVKDEIADFITSTALTTPGNEYYFNVFSDVVRSPMTGLAPNTVNSVANLVRGLSQAQQSTAMETALNDLRVKLPAGSIAVLFTDGFPNDPAATTVAADALKAKGITLITIGIGFADENYLASIASPGFAFFDDAFTNLNAKLNEALVIACPCPVCTNSCGVKIVAESTSLNQLAIQTAFSRDVKDIVKYVCQDVNGVLPAGTNIVNEVNTMAVATATATATAVAKVFGQLYFKGHCDAGTRGGVHLSSTAVAWANVTAKAYVKAVSTIIGANALSGFNDVAKGWAVALASSCQRAIVTATDKKFSRLAVGTSYPDWTQIFSISKTKTVDAVAKAIAEAYADAITRWSLTAKKGELRCSARCVGCVDIIA